MTPEEKSYIESALFLYRKVKLDKLTDYKDIFGHLSDEEFLEQMQTQFVAEVLSRNECTQATLQILLKPSDLIWSSILLKRNSAMTYFNRVLAENGKKLRLLERDESGLACTIRYDLVNDTKGKFQQNLNPNNPQYTQNTKLKVLTEEQKQSRRGFVNEIMQVYRQCELDENYEDRARREESDMRFVIETVEYKGTFEVLNKTALVRVMNLLYAAQNLSLDGQKDYVEALIEKPEISEFLYNMGKDGILDRMSKKVQERKDNGTISIHKPTHGEITIKEANELISQKPNAVEVARRKLKEEGIRTFKVEKGDVKNLRRVRLIEVLAKIDALNVTRKTDSEGNRILQIENGKNLTRG